MADRLRIDEEPCPMCGWDGSDVKHSIRYARHEGRTGVVYKVFDVVCFRCNFPWERKIPEESEEESA
jgi:hypothetical protein